MSALQGLWNWEPDPPTPLDLTNLGPQHQCVCGNNLFQIIAAFGDYVIAQYSTVGVCIDCGAKVRVPTEIDRPDYTP